MGALLDIYAALPPIFYIEIDSNSYLCAFPVLTQRAKQPG